MFRNAVLPFFTAALGPRSLQTVSQTTFMAHRFPAFASSGVGRAATNASIHAEASRVVRSQSRSLVTSRRISAAGRHRHIRVSCSSSTKVPPQSTEPDSPPERATSHLNEAQRLRRSEDDSLLVESDGTAPQPFQSPSVGLGGAAPPELPAITKSPTFDAAITTAIGLFIGMRSQIFF